MNVDLEPGAIGEDEGGWRRALPDCKSPALQYLLELQDIGDAQDDVAILVASGRPPEERIDALATVEPHRDR